MRFSVYQNSRIGGRKYNQDRVAYAYTDEALLLVLADGMGGHLHGELAAEITVSTYMQIFKQAAHPRVSGPEKFLGETMRSAHDAIVDYAQEHNLGGNPGTTCVAALVQDGEVCWAHAGDSRLYLLRGGETAAVTHDHSVVQQWADWGIISTDEMKTHRDRNKITNCLGGVGELFYAEPSTALPLQSGDVLLLCSDGLWSPLVDKEIAAGFLAAPLEATLNKFMDIAVGREGNRADNTTAVVARWGDGEDMHIAPTPICKVLTPDELESASDILGRTRTNMKPLTSG
jgi:serine/threonine protein phosphatase PrpC